MRRGIANCCLTLSEDSLDDDTTVLVIKFRERKVVNMLVGPPENKEDDNRVLKLFFSKEGIRVVCGAQHRSRPSANICKKPFITMTDSQTDEIPAMGRIENVDYVTEGIITLKKVLDLCGKYLENPMTILDFCNKKDAASILSLLLIEAATDINIYFGMAVNDAHEGTEIDFQAKLSLIKQLEEGLQQMNKHVKISFC